jgi:hypothetical protein
VTGQQHAAAEKYEAAREKRCASSFPLDSEKQDTCKHERDSPGNYLPWGYILVAWPEGVAAWAIILTLVVIGWQSNETRNAAIAAAKGVDATITAERSWIIGTLTNVPKWVPEANRLEYLFLMPVFKNYGRTPGRITRITAKVHYLAVEESETLPQEPNYEAEPCYTFRFDGEIVLPSDAAVQPLKVQLVSLTFRNVIDRKLLLYIYWQVDYRDVFGLGWYDRSCYHFHVKAGGFDPMESGFYVSATAAPKSYNRSPEKPEEAN